MRTSGRRGNVVLVTGASAGIGLATADRLARKGWTVVGASRRGTGPEPAGASGGASSSASPAGASGGAFEHIVMDVDDDTSVSSGVARVMSESGRIDAVVAGAGFGVAGPAEMTSIADAKAQLETNFFGAVRVVQAALEPMRRQGGGRIVLVSSLGGVIGLPFQAFYSASKFAMEGYGEALAYEVAPWRIHVTLVQPGNIATDFTKSRRMVAASNPDPYAAAMGKARAVMERDELGGASPELVAKAIERVLVARRPPRRVTVGKRDERAGTFAKRLLPYAVFERAARSSLGV